MPWSFRGQDFAVVADNPIFEEWFKGVLNRTVDPVLTNGGAPRAYVHLGGTSVPPLSMVAQFDDPDDRTSLLGFWRTSGLLEDDDGRSCQAVLAEVVAIRVIKPDSGVVRLGVVFEYLGPA